MLKCLAVLSVLLSTGTAFAQTPPPADPAPVIDEAKSAYAAGELSHTRRALEQALGSVVIKETEAVRAILPKPFEGWTLSDSQNNSVGLAALGGGIALDRTYTNTDGTDVRIEIVSDSPMVESMAQIYDNPAILQAGGMTTDTIAGETAIVDPGGQLIFLIDKRTTFTISGSATPENKKAYAQNIDFAAYRALK